MNIKTEFTPDCMRVLLLFSQKYTRYGILHKMKISPSFTLGQTKVIFTPFFLGGGGIKLSFHLKPLSGWYILSFINNLILILIYLLVCLLISYYRSVSS